MNYANGQSAQDGFMTYVMEKQISVKFHLIQNIRIKGKIKYFDAYAVIVKNEETGNDNLIFKHAIIYMIPSGDMSISYTKPGR